MIRKFASFILALGLLASIAMPTGAPAQRTMVANAGAWSSSTTYAASDIVKASGVYYISRVANNLNHTPSTSPTQWDTIGGGGVVGGTAFSPAYYPTISTVGAATPFNGLQFSSTTAMPTAATPQQIATAFISSSDSTSMYLSSANPSNPGIQNFVAGVGAGSNLSKGGTTPFVGGQSNYISGFNAAHDATTMRESVVIGPNACPLVTGNADGASSEDTVVLCIGSLAGGAFTGTSVGGTPNAIDSGFVGQKAGGGVVTSNRDLFIGNHTGVGEFNVTSSQGSTLVGPWAGAPSLSNVTLKDVNFFGSTGGNIAGGNLQDVNAFGVNTLSSLNPSGAAGTQGNGLDLMGNNGFSNCVACRYSEGLGLNVFGGGTDSFDGSYDIGLGGDETPSDGGTPTGLNVTTGSHDFLVWAAGPSTGSYDIIEDPQSGGAGGASEMLLLGRGTSQDLAGSESGDIYEGFGAGQPSSSVPCSNAIAEGTNAYCNGNEAVVLGHDAQGGSSDLALGAGAEVADSGGGGMAIGQHSDVTGYAAAEIGQGTNTIPGSLAFYGHEIASTNHGGAISACGGGTMVTGSNDHSFKITGIATTTTSCTYTYQYPLDQGYCQVNAIDGNNAIMPISEAPSSTTSAVTFTLTSDASFTQTLFAQCR